jgi:predicted dehydrogenase
VHAFLQRAAGPQDAKKWGHCTVAFPEAKHYRTADEFFADAEIELVVICSHDHEEFVRRALEAGKHGKDYS